MRLIARLLFYPTLWWNLTLNRCLVSRRWWDWVDDAVLLGALPMPHHVPALREAGIGAVVNTCSEYAGPAEAYRAAGIEQLRVPTVDFTPPTLQSVQAAVTFIQARRAQGDKVYVHCKAGRGRSATVVMCYLIAQGMTARAAQELLLARRPHVLPRLYERSVVKEFEASLRLGAVKQ